MRRPGGDIIRFTGEWTFDGEHTTIITGRVIAWGFEDALDAIEERYAALPGEDFALTDIEAIVWRRPNYITKAPPGYEPWPDTDTCFYCGAAIIYGGSGYWLDANKGDCCEYSTEPHTPIAVPATTTEEVTP